MGGRVSIDAGIDHKQHLVGGNFAAVGDLDHRFPFGGDLDDRAFTRIQLDLLAVDLGRDHAHFACRQHVEPQRDFRLAVVDDLHAESGVIRQRGDVCGNILIGTALNCRIGDVDGICLRVRLHRIQAFDRAVERQLFRIELRFNDLRLFARLFGLFGFAFARLFRLFGFAFARLFRHRIGRGFGRGRRGLGKCHFRDGDIAAVDGGIFIDGGIEHHLQALRAVRGIVHDLDGDRFAGGDLEGGAAPVAVGIHRLPVHGGGDVARLGIGRDLLVRHHVDAQSQRFAAVVGDFGGEGIVVFGDGGDIGDVYVFIGGALDARISDVHGVVLADGDGVVVALHGDIRAVDLNGGVGTAGHAGLNRALVREEHHLGQGDAAAVCIFVAAGAV